MTRFAWTGSRPPEGGFTIMEILTVAVDVQRLVRDGDEVGTGGCRGIDELIMSVVVVLRDMGLLNARLITFPADGERTWQETRAPIELIRRSDEVHWRERGWKYLERDRAMVDWAEQVRAVPLHPFEYSVPLGRIRVTRGGTNYTARYAKEHGKLVSVHSLRPPTLKEWLPLEKI